MRRKSMLKNSFIRFQVPALLWTVLIFVLSSIPNLSGPDLGFRLQDKFYHFMFYSFYGLLLARAFFYQQRFRRLSRYFLVLAIFCGMLYGMSDEIHQHYVPGRQMDVWDFAADSLGILAGAFAFYVWHYLKKVSGFQTASPESGMPPAED